MKNRVRHDHPDRDLHGYVVQDSSNVQYVGWQGNAMVVWFKNGGLYRYDGVSRQRAVACARSTSVGKYINSIIKPNFEAVRLA